jgi:hypothetical protein
MSEPKSRAVRAYERNGDGPAAITPPMPAGFVWGAVEIGKVIGRNERQAHHLIYTGKLKSVRKVGSQWCANVAALLAELRGETGEVRS